MALKAKYQGKSISKNKNTTSFSETFYGTEAEVDAYIATLPDTNSASFVEGKGYFTRYTKSPGEGGIFDVECEYTVDYDSGFSNTAGTVVGIKSAQLSVRNIQMPLEAKTGYLTNWNYYLIGRGSVTTPLFWATAENPIIDPLDRKNYMWIKTISELPLEKDEDGNFWGILENPQKPGVEFWDKAVFVVTESAKYNSATEAGEAISLTINKITGPDTTFGITGGNWKHDESSVQYDGKHWIATSVYTHSGDSEGWDTDLYDEV